jgi:hypothetical protein
LNLEKRAETEDGEQKGQKIGENWGAVKNRGYETPLGEAGLSEKGNSNSY